MIHAMILAAGRSRRMGAQKLLLPLGDRTVIARIVDEVLRSPVDRVFAIVGPEGNGVIEAISNKCVDFVTNPDIQGEMLSSVRCGLCAMPDDCTAVLVVLGDQPGIAADVIALLVRAFQTSGRGIVVPIHGGRRGHPLLMSMHYRDEILNCYQDVGLRGLLHAHPEDVSEVEVAAPDVIEDMDVPEDYERAVSLYKKKLEKNSNR
ncbi:MAG: nucleotidyltransferase family protein [Thermoguttaceae bacterium]|jgi:molybdenum cofactor cytidylyltransferase